MRATWRLAAVGAAWVCGLVAGADGAEPARRALVIGIDGCRPDALEAAQTPHLDALAVYGTYFDGTDIRQPTRTDAANTISGPGWSNLLTGVWPDKHNVLDNKFTAPNYDRYPHFFERLKAARPEARTASFSTWPPIARIITRGADDVRNFPDVDPDDLDGYTQGDGEAAAACIENLKGEAADSIVLYLGQVDECGHKHGFHPKVPEYIAAIEQVDRHIGDVLAAVREREASGNERWLVVVCTDHGGSGTDHGNGHDNPEIRRTFLIVSGAGALQGRSEEPTWQVDVVPTVLTYLGVELRPEWELDGRPVGLQPAGP
ncbi:MAG: alkaline phosphatase family protein [Planctomyces sp.]|nr:alkaline phosphatase family protein [Planctomyces sp.]